MSKRPSPSDDLERFRRRVSRSTLAMFAEFSRWTPLAIAVQPMKVDPKHVNRIARGEEIIAEFMWSEIPATVRPLVGAIVAQLVEANAVADLASRVAAIELGVDKKRDAGRRIIAAKRAPANATLRREAIAMHARKSTLSARSIAAAMCNRHQELVFETFRKDVAKWIRAEKLGKT